MRRRLVIVLALLLALTVVVARAATDSPILPRVVILGGGALILWLSEIVPPYVPTLALLAGIPLLLGGEHPEYRIGAVLRWAADPVLALFFGGFALGAAATRHGIDERVAGLAVALSRHRRRRLLALVMVATAALSMWMSNIAAAAMMLAALRPHLHSGDRSEPFRRALLLAVAMSANLGGMATPIGTGPKGIAVASLEPWTQVTFLQWMAFALPLVAGMITLAWVLIVRAHGVGGVYVPIRTPVEPLSWRACGVVVVFGLTVAAWLSEPLHGVSAPVVGLFASALLFGGGWLGREDLGRIDWSTLLLIAGGIVVGRLAQQSGLLEAMVRDPGWARASPAAQVTAFVLLAALMGAVMSNTASAAMLIPIALSVGAPRSVAILIAIGTSFGVPFAISTPPNAMAYGEGGLGARDLLRVGLPLMIVGCLVVGITGLHVLRWIGIP